MAAGTSSLVATPKPMRRVPAWPASTSRALRARLFALGHQGAGVVGVEGAPEHRQPGAAGVALEQLAAKVRLQPADLLAQGRLGDVLARRRLTKVQYLPRVTKAFRSLLTPWCLA